ncbi:MAG: hypothetical protein R2867_40890 [Caldilineaceae bacterium]
MVKQANPKQIGTSGRRRNLLPFALVLPIILYEGVLLVLSHRPGYPRQLSTY